MPARGQTIDKTVPRLCAKGLHMFTGMLCTECRNQAARERYHRKAQEGKAWYQQNKKKQAASFKKWRDKNSEYDKLRCKKRRKENLEEERIRNKKYGQKNPDVVRRKAAKRRANRKAQTPVWANLEEIARIYRECPPGHHVDHIYPLSSPVMCGLHVENNLQYLPAIDNIKKGNRITLDQQLNVA